MTKMIKLGLPIVVCLALGFLSSLFQREALKNWYPFLKKSPLTPPDGVFPIAWTALYVCMGWSLGLILNTGLPDRKFFVWLFAAQLLFNVAWSLTFFYFKYPPGGLITIVILEIMILCYAVLAWSLRRASSILFLPYAAWVGFATYLNFYIVMNN